MKNPVNAFNMELLKMQIETPEALLKNRNTIRKMLRRVIKIAFQPEAFDRRYAKAPSHEGVLPMKKLWNDYVDATGWKGEALKQNMNALCDGFQVLVDAEILEPTSKKATVKEAK